MSAVIAAKMLLLGLVCVHVRCAEPYRLYHAGLLTQRQHGPSFATPKLAVLRRRRTILPHNPSPQSSHTKACPTSALPPCSFQLLSNPSAAVQPRHSTSYECTAHATLAKQDRRSYFNIPPPASLTHLSTQACTQLRRRADTHHTKAARTPSVSHMTHLQFDPSCCLFLSDTQGAPHSALPL